MKIKQNNDILDLINFINSATEPLTLNDVIEYATMMKYYPTLVLNFPVLRCLLDEKNKTFISCSTDIGAN